MSAMVQSSRLVTGMQFIHGKCFISTEICGSHIFSVSSVGLHPFSTTAVTLE